MKSKKRRSNDPSPHIETPNVSPKKRKEKLHEEEDYQLILEKIYEDRIVNEATRKQESDNERDRRSSNSDNSDWELDNQYDKTDENLSNKTADSEWSFGINADEVQKDSPKTEQNDTNCHLSIANCALDHEDELFGDPEIFDPYINQDSPTPKNSRQNTNTSEKPKLQTPNDGIVCISSTLPQRPELPDYPISPANLSDFSKRWKLQAPDDKTMCTPTTGPQNIDFLESPDYLSDSSSNNDDDLKEYLTDSE
ncbi:hypothetical protein DdX_12163 [Ditylenchus destructor]|uniref:Uncharacterized protein n=1 Tax=Ditylenchus destructor TaxID=166010 RepID=A0AAD4R0M8_9BILA|nr:hypothetical protein DdX_12163 [Ditylenchus destructor]